MTNHGEYREGMKWMSATYRVAFRNLPRSMVFQSIHLVFVI